jgi:hypothetical protein
MKKLLILLVTFGLIAGPASLLSAGERGTTCDLTGKARFRKGLTLVPTEYKFSFTGKLTDCESTGRVKSGIVEAEGKANAACEAGTTVGKAKVDWNTGESSVIRFSTYDVGASVTVVGRIAKSTERSMSKKDRVLGEVVFQADASKCATGLKRAAFSGQLLTGSAQ